ncbi:Homeodomain-like [Phytophthora cactorum]|nr:Homeodomain-like [Phytophthora cactorum]
MTISANVRKELFEMTNSEGKLIRIKPTEAKAGTTVYSSKQSQPLKMWTQEEHEKPWKVIAAYIGTKTTRQTMTHAQKYRQKISRWRRGLRHKGRKQAGDDGSQHSEADTQEYSAKENLFKAIEYVSGDEMAGHYGRLFRLAELASIEVMKQEPVAMADMSSPVAIKQCPEEVVARASVEFSEKIRKMEWGNNLDGFIRPSPEWCMQKTEVRLSPLRASPDGSPFPARKFGGVLSAITEMSYQNAQNRLPLPLSSTPMLSPCVSQLQRLLNPPLRSKIDPSVLSGRAYYTPTN